MAPRDKQTGPKTSPHMPAEVLQTIFRKLSFYDLMRCKRVCKTWNAYLPGDDPVLHRKLFSKADFTDEEDDSRIFIHLRAPVVFVSEEGKLPRLGFSIDVLFRSTENFDEGTVFHPMVKKLESFMHLVNPYFVLPKQNLLPRQRPVPVFTFSTFEQLKEMTKLPKGYNYKDGSWKKMLLCVPAVKQVKVDFNWSIEGYGRRYTLNAAGETGEAVSVGQFVKVMRLMLAHAEKNVRGFSGSMAVYCNDCGLNMETEDFDDVDYYDF
ncbi:Nn.00g016650.m01.CDS01 [Neocucurbitaria sp. VM-36]